MSVWYNEIDPLKAEVLRVAIRAGAIAPGDVDERSIADIEPAELMGYTQCHFFAGGGFWSLALRLAGWPDDRPVWTGSCPCPSFSAAGKGLGFDDPRHLWPHWAQLIRFCRPAAVIGEQADDAVGFGWLDLVQTDLEAEAYAVGKVVLGTASVGGADIRQRLYFVAHTMHAQRRPFGIDQVDGRNGQNGGREEARCELGTCGEVRILADSASDGCREEHADGRRIATRDRSQGLPAGFDSGGDTGELGHAHSVLSELDARERPRSDAEERAGSCGEPTGPSAPGRLANPDGRESRERRLQPSGEHRQQQEDGGAGPLADAGYGHESDRCELGSETEGAGSQVREQRIRTEPGASGIVGWSSPLNGPWRDADWLLCRDGKWRPVEGGTFPLAHGDPARLGRLRLYGDAINVEVAKTFIQSYLDTSEERP